MRRAIGYVQGSTNAPNASGVPAGDAAIGATAASLGLDLVRTYSDTATEPGASLDAWPGLVNALGTLEPGDTLLMAPRHREGTDHRGVEPSGVDPLQMAMIERVVEKRGARVVTSPVIDDVRTEPSAVTNRVREAFAEYEELLATTQRRSAPRARRPRNSQARQDSAASQGAGEGRGAKESGNDRPDTSATSDMSDMSDMADTTDMTTVSDKADTAQAMLAVVRGHLQAGWAAPDIAEELNRRGFATVDGSPWRAPLVREVVARRNLGLVQSEPGFKRAEAFVTEPVVVPRDPVSRARSVVIP